MGKFTVIPQDAFEGLQMDAGILLYYFDITSGKFKDEDLICATTGGINAVCKASYDDMAADVDNAADNMMEMKKLTGWECTLGFTSLGMSPKAIKMALGAADIDGQDKTKIIPRRNLLQSDFTNVWWVGDKADGGMVAIELKNALSNEGFSLQTTKNGKGQLSVTLMGHVSIDAQDEMPMVFYSMTKEEFEKLGTESLSY